VNVVAGTRDTPIFAGGGGGLVMPGRMVVDAWASRKVMSSSCGFWRYPTVADGGGGGALKALLPESDEFLSCGFARYPTVAGGGALSERHPERKAPGSYGSVYSWYTILTLAGYCSSPDMFSISCFRWRSVRAESDGAECGCRVFRGPALTMQRCRFEVFVWIHNARQSLLTNSSCLWAVYLHVV
jgi:hypothetical protein